MHILVLPGWLDNRWKPSPASGLFFIEQANMLRRETGWRVNILYPQVSSISIKRKRWRQLPLEVSRNDGMEIWKNYRLRWLNSKKTLAISAMEEMWNEYVKRHGKPDMLWVQSAVGMNRYVVPHCRTKYDTPYFIVEHSARFLSPQSSRHQRRYQEIFAGAEFVAAVGGQLRKTLSSLCPQAIVLHNPINPLFFKAGVISAAASASPFVFHATAKLAPGKRIDVLINAFSKMIQSGADCLLTIAGDGERLHALRQQAADAGVAKRVRFTGFLDREALCAVLLKANAYVLASERETFNLGLVEALTLGLPCVATPVGVAVDIIDDDNGFLTQGFDEDAIFKGMQAVYKKQYDNAAIAMRMRQFSSEKWAKSLVHLITTGGTRI